MIRGVLAILSVLVIVAISAPLARAETLNCSAPPADLSRFRPATRPGSAVAEPFFTADGKERSLDEFRGKGAVVNFWATWCPPCITEMPSLDRLAKALATDGIPVLALSQDRGEAAPTLVQRFFAERGLDSLDVLIDRRGKVGRNFKITGLPTTVLLDADGREIGRLMGPAEWDAAGAVAFIRNCLGQQQR